MRDDLLRRVSDWRFLSCVVAPPKFRLRRNGIQTVPARFALLARRRLLFYRQLASRELADFYDFHIFGRARGLPLGERIPAGAPSRFRGLFLRADAVSS